MSIPVEAIEKAAAKDLESVKPAPPDAQLVEHFDRLMAGGGEAGNVSPLHSISEVASKISRSKQDILARLSGPEELSPAELLQLQYKLTQINLYQEMVAKTVGRLTQNVETMMKTQ